MTTCKKCNGEGWYFYDHNHSTICDQCCTHDKGWWDLTKELHGSLYIDGGDNGCCLNGCGTMRRDTPDENDPTKMTRRK
jgi:hypothetical protein